jgi:hypothetical protein
MADYDIALQLMGLYGKLRRATDVQSREAIKGRIDRLVAELGRERYLREVVMQQPAPPASGRK